MFIKRKHLTKLKKTQSKTHVQTQWEYVCHIAWKIFQNIDIVDSD